MPFFFALAAKSVASFFEFPVSVASAIVILPTVGLDSMTSGSFAFLDITPARYPFIQINSSGVQCLINSNNNLSLGPSSIHGFFLSGDQIFYSRTYRFEIRKMDLTIHEPRKLFMQAYYFSNNDQRGRNEFFSFQL